MTRSLIIISFVIFSVSFGARAQNGENEAQNSKKKQSSTSSQTKKGEIKESGNNAPAVRESKSGHVEKANDIRNEGETSGEVLGDDNKKAKQNYSNNDGSNSYTDKPSGNPNNRQASEGSNRRSGAMQRTPQPITPQERVKPTGNSSTGFQGTGTKPADEMPGSKSNNPSAPGENNTSGNGSSTQDTGNGTPSTSTAERDLTAGTSSAPGTGTATGNTTDPAASNAPSVIQRTSSQSGSPSVLSEEKGTTNDGTNNVQRASTNMAGSPAVKSSKKNIDQDQEISKGTGRQQTSSVPNDVSKEREAITDGGNGNAQEGSRDTQPQDNTTGSSQTQQENNNKDVQKGSNQSPQIENSGIQNKEIGRKDEASPVNPNITGQNQATQNEAARSTSSTRTKSGKNKPPVTPAMDRKAKVRKDSKNDEASSSNTNQYRKKRKKDKDS